MRRRFLMWLSKPHAWETVMVAAMLCVATNSRLLFSVIGQHDSFGATHVSAAALKNELPTESGLIEKGMLPKPLALSVDCQIAPCIALTFDDGPDSVTTPQVLNILNKTGAKATFFVLGGKIAGHEQLLQKMQAMGNEIGNHSWNHPDFMKLRPDERLDQINMTQAALVTAGVPAANLFRPPYESLTPEARINLPLPIALWNVDPKDWNEQDPNELAHNIISQARPGAIIIMHDTHRVTVAALPEIIKQLNKTYQLVTLEQLVQLPPGANGETVIY